MMAILSDIPDAFRVSYAGNVNGDLTVKDFKGQIASHDNDYDVFTTNHSFEDGKHRTKHRSFTQIEIVTEEQKVHLS